MGTSRLPIRNLLRKPGRTAALVLLTAVLAASLLTVLGVVAGLMPATRAMQIKPVDAMRDE